MRVAVARTPGASPYFRAPVAPALTAESLAAVGLPPEPLAGPTLTVVRTGAKGK